MQKKKEIFPEKGAIGSPLTSPSQIGYMLSRQDWLSSFQYKLVRHIYKCLKKSDAFEQLLIATVCAVT